METKTFHKESRNRFISTGLVLMMVLGCFMVLSPNSGYTGEDQVSRAEFIAMVAKNQPNHPMIPKNHAELSSEELYNTVAKTMKVRGFKALDGKDPKQALTEQEFVRVTYALSGEPPGKSLFEQKLYLKEQGIINSADVGLATGTEGRILQYHKGQKQATNVKLASPVYMNDRIKTQGEAKATFTFDDKSTMTIGEDANVRISKHIYNPDNDLRQTVVKISTGIVRFSVTKGKARGSMFKVITPTATAGVRGTEFIVAVDKSGKTSFIGIEGSIATAPILPNGKEGKSSILKQGQFQNVSVDGIADLVQNFPPGLLKQFNEGKFPPGLLKQAEKGKFPPGLTKIAGKKMFPRDKMSGEKNVGRGKVDKMVKGNMLKKASLGNSDTREAKLSSVTKVSGKGNRPGLNVENTSVDRVAKKAVKKAARQNAKLAAKTAAKQAAKDAVRESTIQKEKDKTKDKVKKDKDKDKKKK